VENAHATDSFYPPTEVELKLIKVNEGPRQILWCIGMVKDVERAFGNGISWMARSGARANQKLGIEHLVANLTANENRFSQRLNL
jgi:hypothetical protein